MELRLTIMTPTYNRGYIIDTLYQSLLRQAIYNFEWLVIDDGSTDNTKSYMQNIISEEPPFTINYIFKDNGGKHTCINLATEVAKGKYFFIVDSDDYLPDDAVKKINDLLDDIEAVSNDKLIGVVGLKQDYSTKEIIGSEIATVSKANHIDATFLERAKYNITGDKAEIVRTDIMKRYKFPEFSGEKFITEAIVWNDIGYDGFLVRNYNVIIYLCKYLEDGLTNNMQCISKTNPRAWIYWQWKKIKWYNLGIKNRVGVYGAVYKECLKQTNSQYLLTWSAKLFGVSKMTLKVSSIIAMVYFYFKRRD